jgi:hypothetical protein
MELKEKLKEDMRMALKAGEKVKLAALRLLMAQLKNAEIEKGDELEEDEIFRIIQREARKWEEAAVEYERAGNVPMAEREKVQALVIKSYLPPQLSPEELDNLISATIKEVEASSLKDMGRVMASLMSKIKGRADGKLVSQKVKEFLSQT